MVRFPVRTKQKLKIVGSSSRNEGVLNFSTKVAKEASNFWAFANNVTFT